MRAMLLQYCFPSLIHFSQDLFLFTKNSQSMNILLGNCRWLNWILLSKENIKYLKQKADIQNYPVLTRFLLWQNTWANKVLKKKVLLLRTDSEVWVDGGQNFMVPPVVGGGSPSSPPDAKGRTGRGQDTVTSLPPMRLHPLKFPPLFKVS